jgi:hypothetical protein
VAIPQPEPKDWALSNAQILRITDREVLAMLRAAYRTISAELNDLIAKDSPLISAGVQRAQMEQTRARLLAEQANVFRRLGDIVSARRLDAASRAQRLSAAADAALLALVGKAKEAQFLYQSALQASQAGIDAALARMRLSALPLSQRIYNSSVWMNDRLGKLINETLVSGLNAREFAKKARDWFNPNTPGGVRYAAMRLARTEINNSFHATSAEKYATTPWITKVEWNLSGSHPKPDECNVLAAASPYDSDETPARPHPQCMCYITPVSIDEDEFVENFLAGDYDEYLDGELEKNGWNVTDSEGTTPAERLGPKQVLRPKTTGSDATEWVASQMRDGHRRDGINKQTDFNDPVDNILRETGKHQGFDALPSYSDLNKEVAKGGVELHRGVIPFSGPPEVKAETIIDRFRSGAYEPGTGIYGNGFYFSVSKRVADYFAGPKKALKGGISFRAVLRKDAKVIEYGQLQKDMKEWRKLALENSPDLGDLFGKLDFQTPEGMIPPSMIDTFMDPGRFAALMGYDAILVTGQQDGAPFVKGEPSAKNSAGGKFSAHDQYVILNRSAIFLEAL